MRKIQIIIILLVLSLAFGPFKVEGVSQDPGGVSFEAQDRIDPPADPASGSNVMGGVTQLISSTDEGVEFTVEIPWNELMIEPVREETRDYSKISLPGWAETAHPGLPELPMTSVMIGVPFDAGLSVEVVPGKSHPVHLSAPVLPVVTQTKAPDLPNGIHRGITEVNISTSYDEDITIFSSNRSYPGQLAIVANDGILRQQRVVGISLVPVQYNPLSSELTIYESMEVVVRFTHSDNSLSRSSKPETPEFENLLSQALLNYESAREWRQFVPAAYSTTPGMEELRSGLPWVVPDPAWRIAVQNDGLYRLTYTELASAGLPVGDQEGHLDPRTLQLYHLGEAVAIKVVGEDDGVFNLEDQVIFYGQGIESKYTTDNIYWLTYDAAGVSLGTRMETRDGTPGMADAVQYHNRLDHLETNVWYLQDIPAGEYLDQWFWGYVYPPSEPSWNQSFVLTSPYLDDPEVQATLQLSMLGYLNYPAYNPDHHAVVLLNGTQIGDFTWDGISWQNVEMQFNSGLLLSGSNTLTVTCPNDTGVGLDVVWIDWLEINFPANFKAENDVLAFDYENPGTLDSTYLFSAAGFTNSGIEAYDVSNPTLVEQLLDGVVNELGGEYSLTFQDSIGSSSSGHYQVTTNSAYQTVVSITKDTPSDLATSAMGADHVIITHADFSLEADALKTYRGIQSVVVDVQDIYDQFGYGITGIQPIHDFLAYAYNSWQSSYVVLVGDGHYDPKDYMEMGKDSFIFPYLAPVDPVLGETAADNRYVTLIGADTLPDMMLGRLAVSSSTEANAFVSKITSYEENSGDWQKKILMVADNTDGGGNFAGLSDQLIADYLPGEFTAEKVYYGITHTSVTEARQAIKDGINTGKMLVNYIGHGNTDFWASEVLFKNSDVASLAVNDHLPVMLTMTCNNGYYIDPTPDALYDSLAEAVTKADGKGAVASWSPTGWGYASGHHYLNQGFFQAVFEIPGEQVTLGQAAVAGLLQLWSSGSNLDLIDTFLVFGDPAMMLRTIPPQAPINLQAYALTWSEIQLNWKDNSTSETAFIIERSLDGVSGWTEIVRVGADVSEYLDSGLDPETTYYYQVRAYREGDLVYSEYSNDANATTWPLFKYYLPLVIR